MIEKLQKYIIWQKFVDNANKGFIDSLYVFNHLFRHICWEDEKPIYILDLL
jgi:hypothetical protein